MTLTPTTFTINPNQYDGRQRLSDPTGTYEPTVNTLQPVTGLTISETTYNSQRLTWQHDEADGIEGYWIDIWVADSDDTWRFLAGPFVGTKTYVSTGLPAETYIRYRVAAAIADTPTNQLSAWTEVDGNTATSPVAGGDVTNLRALTFFYNFEGLPNGPSMQDLSGSPFTAARNMTVDANMQGIGGAGTQCAHTYLSEGTNGEKLTEEGYTGFQHYGYKLDSLPEILEGGECWFRKAIFWPTNAPYQVSNGGL
jgi:hypothetical protein